MTLTELHTELYHKKGNPDYKDFLKLIGDNEHLLDIDPEDLPELTYDNLMQLTGDYANSLVTSETYTKAIIYLDKAIKLFEQNPKFIGDNLYKLGYYEFLIFSRGMTNYNLKKMLEAKYDFETLVEKFPNNEKYINWLNHSNVWRYHKLSNTLWWIFCSALVLHLILEKFMPGDVDLVVLLIGVGAVFLNLGILVLKKIEMNKIKNSA